MRALNDWRRLMVWRVSDDWRRRKERWALSLARALPRWLRYWVTIDSFAKATTGKYSGRHPDEVRFNDVLNAVAGDRA